MFFKERDVSLLLNIQVELNLAYEDFGDNSAIFGGTPSYFEYANGNNYAIIKNDLRFAFVIVDWFEELNRIRLGCPMYRLQMTHTNLSISLVNTIDIVHFVHCCEDKECIEGNKHILFQSRLMFIICLLITVH
ncbi:hypothetical protein RhiirA4_474896 [Rhizophagus irregularis]|uniref:Uncharacterized protein n=1 Tax=Rhizophagus irregularis TaxID=588596 RepID=A0A2I1H9A5_9GLOM|nr:hypothetical protein RhiirA4_474896 [Rhizophagus irregularis]